MSKLHIFHPINVNKNHKRLQVTLSGYVLPLDEFLAEPISTFAALVTDLSDSYNIDSIILVQFSCPVILNTD